MLEFELDKVDLQKWEMFSEPCDTDKTISLLHVGRNGLVLFVTENDDVFIAEKDGHKQLTTLSGHNIVQLASTRDFIVAGTDRKELLLFPDAGFGTMVFSVLDAYFVVVWRFCNREVSAYSIIPKNSDSSISLMGCGDNFILTFDKSNSNLVMFIFEKLTGKKGKCVNEIKVIWANELHQIPLVKLSCGSSHAAAVGTDGMAYCLEHESTDDTPTQCYLSRRALPFPVKNVACVRNTTAFLLQNGEVFFISSPYNSDSGELFYRPEMPTVADITSNGDFFAATSTDSSIFSFTWDGRDIAMKAILPDETNLLKAFEGHGTPSTHLVRHSSRPLRQNTKTVRATPSRSNFIDTESLHDEENFSDLTLLLQDGQIKAHKLILSSHSKFFRKLFKNDDWKNKPMNSSSNVLDVSSYCSVGYRAYIRFIYCGHFNWTDLKYDQLLGVYDIAMGNGEDFENDICPALMNCVNSGNVCDIFKFAVERKLKTLEDRCLQVVKNHRIDVIVSDSFVAMPLGLRRLIATSSFE